MSALVNWIGQRSCREFVRTRTEKKRRWGLASLGEKGGREEIDCVEGTVNRESRREDWVRREGTAKCGCARTL